MRTGSTSVHIWPETTGAHRPSFVCATFPFQDKCCCYFKPLLFSYLGIHRNMDCPPAGLRPADVHGLDFPQRFALRAQLQGATHHFFVDFEPLVRKLLLQRSQGHYLLTVTRCRHKPQTDRGLLRPCTLVVRFCCPVDMIFYFLG